eukprot:3710705-Rhodomonas_salina.8
MPESRSEDAVGMGRVAIDGILRPESRALHDVKRASRSKSVDQNRSHDPSSTLNQQPTAASRHPSPVSFQPPTPSPGPSTLQPSLLEALNPQSSGLELPVLNPHNLKPEGWDYGENECCAPSRRGILGRWRHWGRRRDEKRGTRTRRREGLPGSGMSKVRTRHHIAKHSTRTELLPQQRLGAPRTGITAARYQFRRA